MLQLITFFFFLRLLSLHGSGRFVLLFHEHDPGIDENGGKKFFLPFSLHETGSNISKKTREKKYGCPFIRIINKRYRRGAERLSRKSHATHGHLYRMCDAGWTGKFRKKSLRRVKLHKIGEIKRFSRGNDKLSRVVFTECIPRYLGPRYFSKLLLVRLIHEFPTIFLYAPV